MRQGNAGATPVCAFQRLWSLQCRIEVVWLVPGAQRRFKILFTDVELAVQRKAVDRARERGASARFARPIAWWAGDEVYFRCAEQLSERKMPTRRVRPLEG